MTTVPSPTTTLPPNPVGSGPSIDFVDDTNGWAGGSGGVFATVDGGTTWHLQYSSTPQPSGSGVLTGVGALDFLDADHGWAVDGGTLIETTDGGAVWRQVGKGGALEGAAQLHFFDLLDGWAVVHRIPCFNAGCVTEGSLLSTTDGGLTWAPVQLSGPTLAMCWASPMVGWAGGRPLLNGTRNGGQTWTAIHLPNFYPPPADPFQGPGTTITSIACSGDTAWVFGDQGLATGHEGYTVDRTLDSGTRWLPVLGGETGKTIDDYGGPIAASTPQAAYFVGSCPNCLPVEASITITNNGGNTFQRYRINPNSDAVDAGLAPTDVSFPDSLHGWLLGAIPAPYNSPNGVIYATTNGGQTWKEQYKASGLSPPG